MKKNKNIGSSFESFLEQEGMLEEVTAAAIKAVIAHNLKDYMTKEQITQTDMAKQLGTSRSGLQRLLDPNNTSITLVTLNRAAILLGKKIEMTLVPLPSKK
ncbi:helix-turn-helix domain-containing protein [Candidatus Dependentiae bacterium]|nr:helix-turn-helix domain-containing protein [Candidatus Dependentiae bacterium]